MKRAFLVLIVLILATPMVVGLFNLVKEKPLDGVFVGEKVFTLKYFTWTRWFDDRFQEAMNKAYAQKMGFRNTLIRVANHLDFLALRKLHADKAILGKDNYLFEEGYIIDYLGRNYMGSHYVRENMRRFKMAQDILKKRYNIDFILVLEPGKAGTYPEKIPMQYLPKNKTTSNYQTVVKMVNELKINCLNLQSYFTAIKDTSKHPLYPKYGVHWSTYGMWLAADTLLKFTSSATNINLAQIKWHGIKTTDELKDVDFDLEKTINLLVELPHEILAYPTITIDTVNKVKPRVLTIADSYYWSIFDNKIPHQVFANADFWYYNTTIYPDIWGDNAKRVKDLNVMEQIKENQIIFFMITEMNLYKSFWGFTDTIIKHELPDYVSPKWFFIANKMVNNSVVYDKIRKYCDNYKLPFDQILYKLALFVSNAERYPETESNRKFWIIIKENNIYTNQDILNMSRDKAKTNNITLLKSVYLDACWLYQEEIKQKSLTLNL